MNKLSKIGSIAMATALATGWVAMTSANSRTLPSYPKGYRQWAHVKSALVSEGHAEYESSGGFRHIYANDQALSGYRSGKFPEGSIIVVDWLAERDSGGMFEEGQRRRVDVMIKDSRTFASTGGWGFERFKGDSRTERIVKDVSSQCFACHAGQKSADFVFSTLRD
ncbi:MAG TPA: cytochrome P460 family protein [Steroidobacter sp.]|uniref:cytochrome P460 family protein n=1 Tax=Steroidobacter sp. TaxID=1978227 RepID=UPI002EDB3B54